MLNTFLLGGRMLAEILVTGALLLVFFVWLDGAMRTKR